MMPSKYTDYYVKYRRLWRNGSGDNLAELAEATRNGGLKLGCTAVEGWSDEHPSSEIFFDCCISNAEYLPIVNVGSEELISDCYNSVVKVNQKYKNKDTLVSVMRNYAIKHKFNFRAERSDKQSYVLLCKSLECSWVFKASCKHGTDTFIIRTFNDEHTCSIMDRVFEQHHVTIAFIAGITTPKLVTYKRIITPSNIIEDIKMELGLDIDYMKAWQAKECALKILKGRPTDRYKKMPTYVYMLNSVYLNSHIRMHKSPANQFMYLFVTLQPFIREFGYCRPVVVVDGSHMRGPYQGTFVSASTLDGADSENDSSWTCFFQQFKCAFSERDNIKSKDKLTSEFFAMAKGYKLDDFDELMCKVGKIDNRFKAYWENVGFEKWSRVHAPINRGRMMTSNITECINSHLVEARELPILDFLEQVRILFGVWNHKNRERSSFLSKKSLGGWFKQILQLNEAKSSRMMLDEIPCAHAIAILKSKHVKEMKPYCSDYYKKETLVKTYEMPLCPMPDKRDWNVLPEVLEDMVLPPKYKRPPGRPKKGRKRKVVKSFHQHQIVVASVGMKAIADVLATTFQKRCDILSLKFNQTCLLSSKF
ncbi:uncharacterized protein LOC124885792 [Capsicum annuum]|uniref:uncharacterized protein LOC124885792 n=1 Tax=Capsicum annuum TaxID=4072 RepID=UPI001FB17AF3|nr:uncharacterized protein LOC124885792 [Capsicum annuum]